MNKAFDEVFDDVTRFGTKVKTDEYRDSGTHIIIDQGQGQIAGYTDLEKGLFTDIPAIVFGDHTRIIKYVEKPFFLGADGVKVFRSKDDNANYKYLYYALKHVDIPNTGYNRHFKWLKASHIPYPSYTKQKQIVEVLDLVVDIMDKRRKELSALDDLAKSRFMEMFGDSPNAHYTSLKECSISISGGSTPSMEHAEFYGGDIPFVKSGDVKSDYVSSGTLWLTQCALEQTTAKYIPTGTVIVVTRSGILKHMLPVAIASNPIVINQDIKAFELKPEYNPIYIAWAIRAKSDFLLHQTRAMTVDNIESKDLYEIPIMVVSKERQEQFVTIVKHLDKSKLAIQKNLDELQLLYDSLMQEYFG